MLLYILYTIFILACVVLILGVLLQPGKADAGQLFTSSFSSTAFGPRGTQTLLAKITIGAAIVFMLVALLISMGVGGYRSVVSDETGGTPTTPETTNAPAQDDSTTAPEELTLPLEQEGTEQTATTPGATASPEGSPQ